MLPSGPQKKVQPTEVDKLPFPAKEQTLLRAMVTPELEEFEDYELEEEIANALRTEDAKSRWQAPRNYQFIFSILRRLDRGDSQDLERLMKSSESQAQLKKEHLKQDIEGIKKLSHQVASPFQIRTIYENSAVSFWQKH
jgi:hypothetical protein